MPALYRPVRIKDSLFEGNLFLAPLAGFSDLAFRSLCVDFGAACVITEMLSAEGFIRNNQKTFELLKRAPQERFFGVQIFSGSPYSAAQAVKTLNDFKPTFIDLNCGCPVPKVTKNGAGSALLRNPRFLFDIVKAMRDNTDLPVTVKIRLGWDAGSVNYLETSDAAVQAGAAMICLHARTRNQGYSGEAKWNDIKELKQHCPVPVFGSGDLFSPEAAKKMLEDTGCDGIMFARGAIGNPFIFQETKALLQASGCAAPSFETRIQTGLEHLRRCAADKGETSACLEMRKHFCSYVKGIPGSSRFRSLLVQASTIQDYENSTKEFLAELAEHASWEASKKTEFTD